jgi:hypothetical protein
MTSDRTFVANQEGQIGVLRQKDDGTHEHVHTLKDLKVWVMFIVELWHASMTMLTVHSTSRETRETHRHWEGGGARASHLHVSMRVFAIAQDATGRRVRATQMILHNHDRQVAILDKDDISALRLVSIPHLLRAPVACVISFLVVFFVILIVQRFYCESLVCVCVCVCVCGSVGSGNGHIIARVEGRRARCCSNHSWCCKL